MQLRRADVGVRVLVLAMAVATICCPRHASAERTLTISAGIGRRVRQGSWTPISVLIGGSGAATRGRLVLTVTSRGGSQTYAKPVVLPAGPTRDRHTLYGRMPDWYGEAQMSVRLETPGAATVAAPVEVANWVDRSTHWLVALTPDRGGLHGIHGQDLGVARESGGNGPHFSGFGSMAGRAEVTYPSLETLPDAPPGYTDVDMLLLGDVDVNRLSDPQWEAIAAWVEGGGRLVISGGPGLARLRGQRVYPLLPIEPASVTTADGLADLGRRFGSAPAGVVPICTGPLRPGARAICADQGRPLVAERPYGCGVVVYTAFDLLGPECRGWGGRKQLWGYVAALRSDATITGIVRAAMGRGSYYYGWGYPTESRLGDALAGARSTDVPGLGLIGSFLGAYIVLLAPLNYFVLRRLDRKELAWFTSLAIVVLFTVGAYAIGRSTKGSTLWLRYLTVAEGIAGSGVFRAHTVATLCSPSVSWFDISVPDPAAPVQEVTEGVSRYELSRSDMAVDQEPGTTVKGAQIGMWDHRTFRFETTVRAGSGVTASVRSAGSGRVSVTVTNHTGFPLRSCMVGSAQEMVTVGDLAPGQTATRSLARPPTGKWPGLAHRPSTAGGAAEIESAFAALMRDQYQNETPVPLFFAGWSQEPLAGLAVPNASPKVEGTTLIVAHLDAAGDRPRPRTPTQAVSVMPGPTGAPPAAYRTGQSQQAAGRQRAAYRYVQSGQLPDALREAKLAMSLAPKDASMIDTVGEIYQRMGDDAEAIRYYRKSLRLAGGSGSPETHAKLGEALLALKRTGEARTHLTIAARQKDTYWGIRAADELRKLGAMAKPTRKARRAAAP